MSAHCELKDYLNQALRDRLECGLRAKSIQKRLLAEADLTLKKALELAQDMEATDRNAKSLKMSESAVSVMLNVIFARKRTHCPGLPSQAVNETWG